MQPVFESVAPDLAADYIHSFQLACGSPLGLGFMALEGGNWKFLVPKVQEDGLKSGEAYIVYTDADCNLIRTFDIDIFDEKSPHSWSAYMFDHPEFGSKADYDLSHEYDPPLRDEPEAVSCRM